jgi:hypothetical protein
MIFHPGVFDKKGIRYKLSFSKAHLWSHWFWSSLVNDLVDEDPAITGNFFGVTRAL